MQKISVNIFFNFAIFHRFFEKISENFLPTRHSRPVLLLSARHFGVLVNDRPAIQSSDRVATFFKFGLQILQHHLWSVRRLHHFFLLEIDSLEKIDHLSGWAPILWISSILSSDNRRCMRVGSYSILVKMSECLRGKIQHPKGKGEGGRGPWTLEGFLKTATKKNKFPRFPDSWQSYGKSRQRVWKRDQNATFEGVRAPRVEASECFIFS